LGLSRGAASQRAPVEYIAGSAISCFQMMGTSHQDSERFKKVLSNSQVAKQAGVHPGTLERWLASGKLRQPKVLISGGRIVRLWKQADVEHIQRYKEKNYGKAHRGKNHGALPVDGDEQVV
jgi:MerR HTH family regulatory protein